MDRIKCFFNKLFSFKALYGWADPKAYLFVKIFTPISQLIFFCMTANFIYNTTDVTKYVLGNAIILCSYNCIFGVGNTLIEERYHGTLKNTVVSPSNTISTFARKMLIHIFDSLVTVIASLLAGILIFKADFSAISLGAFTLILFGGIFSACCMGLLLSAIGLVTDSINLILNLVSLLFLVFTGANYPIERLPIAARMISNLLPLTRSIQLGSRLLNGETFSSQIMLFVGELSIGLVYLMIGFFLMRVLERVSIEQGTLDMF